MLGVMAAVQKRRDRSTFGLPTPTPGTRNTDSEAAHPGAVSLHPSDSEPSARGEDKGQTVGQAMPRSSGGDTGDLRTRQRRRRRKAYTAIDKAGYIISACGLGKETRFAAEER
jgi:hypothetical protein